MIGICTLSCVSAMHCRRDGVDDKYPTDKLWAYNGKIATTAAILRELIACFKKALQPYFDHVGINSDYNGP